MECKKCGASLPSEGFICKRCGAMMSEAQIKEQKKYNQDNNKSVELTFLSDRYSNKPIDRNFKKINDNKYLGAILIILIVIILIIVAILKVM